MKTNFLTVLPSIDKHTWYLFNKITDIMATTDTPPGMVDDMLFLCGDIMDEIEETVNAISEVGMPKESVKNLVVQDWNNIWCGCGIKIAQHDIVDHDTLDLH